MNDSRDQKARDAVDRALAFAEAALSVCDDHGLIYPAIDLSAAIDKLQRIKLHH